MEYRYSIAINHTTLAFALVNKANFPQTRTWNVGWTGETKTPVSDSSTQFCIFNKFWQTPEYFAVHFGFFSFIILYHLRSSSCKFKHWTMRFTIHYLPFTDFPDPWKIQYLWHVIIQTEVIQQMVHVKITLAKKIEHWRYLKGKHLCLMPDVSYHSGYRCRNVFRNLTRLFNAIH